MSHRGRSLTSNQVSAADHGLVEDDSVFVDQPLGAFLEMLASSNPTPGGGAAAAVAVALASGLVAMAARFSMDHMQDSFEIAERADTIRVRVAALAEDDAVAYGRVLDAYRSSSAVDQPARRIRIGAALSDAADVPLAVARTGVEVADLAARVATEGNANLRGDAAMAALLAHAAVRGAVMLVHLNLDLAGMTDGRMAESERLVHEAERARQATLDSVAPKSSERHGE